MSWANLEFPRPPIVKLIWTERFEEENISLCFSSLIMILRGSEIKENHGGGEREEELTQSGIQPEQVPLPSFMLAGACVMQSRAQGL